MNKFQKLLYYIKNYKFNSILIRNFLIIILLIIIPLSSITLLLYNNMTEAVKSEITLMNTNSLAKVRAAVDNIFENLEKMLVIYSIDEKVELFIKSTENKPLIENQFYDIYEMLNRNTLIYNYINSIYLYSEKRDSNISTELERDDTWLDKLRQEKNQKSSYVYLHKKFNIYPYLISLIRPIFTSNNKERLGAILINVDIEELGKLIKRSQREEEENILIVDMEGRIVFSQDIEQFDKKMAEIPQYRQISFEEEYSSIMKIDDGKYAVAVVNSRKNNWKYISVQPLTIYAQRLEDVVKYIYILLVTIAVIIFIIAIVISVKTFNPVMDVISILENPKTSYGTEKNAVDKKNNEMKLIAQNILRTIFLNEKLKKELEGRLELLNQAQIVALQAQINPHFLHNTLENIRWLAVDLTQKENKPSKMITNLSKLLRLSLDSKKQLVSIREEIEHAKCYIEIMKVRYEEGLHVEWEIQEEIMNEAIVKLVLQPLIENSIYYSQRVSQKECRIKINGVEKSSEIIIVISDNGIGMSESQISEMNTLLKQDYKIKSEHIGIYNVNQRIKLIMGEMYGITLANNEAGGLSVEIRLSKKM